MNSQHYTYRVTWSAADGEHVATVAEFPSLSWLDVDLGEALQGLVRLVEDVVADMQANGEAVPEPLADRHYSGKFNVRVTENRHRELVLAAAEQGVSLNRLVNDRLAHG